MTSGSVPRRPPRGLAPRGPGYDGEGGGFGRDAATLPIPYPARASPAGGGVPWPTKAKQPTSPSKTHTLVCLARRGAPDQAPRAKHPDWLRTSINLHMRDPHPVRRRDSPPSRPWGGLPHFHTSNAHSRYSLAHRRPTEMRAGG